MSARLATWFAAVVALVVTTLTTPAWAEPTRILVSVGSQRGLAAERPLHFAHTDAGRVRDVLVSQGGVRAGDATVLVEPSRAQLFTAIDGARARAAAQGPREVTLLFYFSGHGDREALHLGDERVPLSDLTTKLGEVPAGLRIVVTDACRATRDKGFTADAPFAISVATLPQASGTVWLHASADGEAAQESDELEGAIFTHAWLSGLRGAADVNGDARVTLEESFAFAHAQTLLRSSRSSGVLQKPEAVMDLREAAPVILTQSSARLASLSLPAARDTHFLVYAQGARTVVAELWGSPSRRTLLAVPAGRYVVQQRAGGAGAAAHVAVAEGEERAMDSRDFVPAPLEVLAQKGGQVTEAARHEVIVGYDVGGNGRSGLVHGPRAGYARVFSWGALTAGAAAELTGDGQAVNPERVRGGYARVGVEPRLAVGPVLLRAGAGGRAGVLWQSLALRDPRTGVVGSAASEHTAFAFGPEVYGGARVGTGDGVESRFFLDLGVSGNVLFLREESTLKGVPGGAATSAVGASF